MCQKLTRRSQPCQQTLLGFLCPSSNSPCDRHSNSSSVDGITRDESSHSHKSGDHDKLDDFSDSSSSAAPLSNVDSYLAVSFEALEKKVSSSKMAKYAYAYMAQPLGQ